MQTVAYTTNTTGSYATKNTVMTIGNFTQIVYTLPLGPPRAVYTLPSPVTFSSAHANWTSPSFYLQSGMAFELTAVLCEDCFIAIIPANGPVNETLTYDFNINPPKLGMNNYTVIGLVTNSGNYVIFLHNTELRGTVTSISVFEMTASLQTSPATSQLTQATTLLATVNLTAYSTSNSTAYTQSMKPPYAIIGWGASAAIILVVATIAAFAILFDRGSISRSISTKTKHRRKRRK